MRKTLLAAAPILMIALGPTTSHADNVGAVFGAGTGLLAAGPVGLIVGGIVGWYGGVPSGGRRLIPEHVLLTITGTGTVGTMVGTIRPDTRLAQSWPPACWLANRPSARSFAPCVGPRRLTDGRW
jgi:hypothetical protein